MQRITSGACITRCSRNSNKTDSLASCDRWCALRGSAPICFSPCFPWQVFRTLPPPARASDRSKDSGGRGVVPEGLTDVHETIHISRSENKAAAQLKRVFAQAMLPVPAGFGAYACRGVVLTQKVEQGSFPQLDGLVGFTLLVNQEREIDLGVLTELAGIVGVAQAYGYQFCALLLKILLVFAQLRDMLAAKNSAVVSKENDNCRTSGPERSQAHRFSVDVGQS